MNETNPDRTPIPGSERAPVPNAQVVGPPSPDERATVTLVLRRRLDGQPGADPEDLDVVTATLRDAGLEIVLADGPSRRVRVAGPVTELAAVFGTSLSVVDVPTDDGTLRHRQRSGGLSVPGPLAGPVIAVLGLDDRPQAETRYRALSAAQAARALTPLQIGGAYRFPAGSDGAGQVVAVIELGGGFDQKEVDTYLRGLGLEQFPQIDAVGVDGATNVPGADPSGADGEVLLDIEVVGALAPGARIAVYFAPNTDAGFLDAVSEALHANPTPAAISISWGMYEDGWTAQARQAFDSVFADAVAMDVVVTVAAGDNGSGDAAPGGAPTVDFPAASPNVLACGGTRLELSGAALGAETVWNDGTAGGATGGGISGTFARPPRQDGLVVAGSGRGVPDVAGNADPQTGYQVLVDGQRAVIGGTSAVAPLWASLVARLAQAAGGRLPGFLDALYAGATPDAVPAGFHDITQGDNGAWSAAPGWDACTGLGSPDGEALLTRLRGGTAP